MQDNDHDQVTLAFRETGGMRRTADAIHVMVAAETERQRERGEFIKEIGGN